MFIYFNFDFLMNFLFCYLNYYFFIKYLFSNVNGILGILLYVIWMVML